MYILIFDIITSELPIIIEGGSLILNDFMWEQSWLTNGFLYSVKICEPLTIFYCSVIYYLVPLVEEFPETHYIQSMVSRSCYRKTNAPPMNSPLLCCWVPSVVDCPNLESSCCVLWVHSGNRGMKTTTIRTAHQVLDYLRVPCYPVVESCALILVKLLAVWTSHFFSSWLHPILSNYWCPTNVRLFLLRPVMPGI
jgi:hypothetical protein